MACADIYVDNLHGCSQQQQQDMACADIYVDNLHGCSLQQQQDMNVLIYMLTTYIGAVYNINKTWHVLIVL